MNKYNFSRIPLSLPLVASLILGITWKSFGWIIYFPLVVFAAALIFFWENFKKKENWVVYLALLGFTFFVGSLLYSEERRNFFRFYYKTIGKNWSVIAKVTDIEKSYKGDNENLVTLKIKKLFNAHREISSCGGRKLKIKTKKEPTFEIGDIIKLEKFFFRRCGNYDFIKYMIKENLAGYIYLKNPQAKILEHSNWNLVRSIRNLRNHVVERLHKKLSKPTFTLLASIFFGKKMLDEKEMDKIRDGFRNWGIIHHLARSGLHLIIFILLFSFLLSYLPIPFATKELLTVLLVLFYAAFSWISLSFMRAMALFLLYKFCSLQKLQTHAVHLISLVAIALLVWNPYQLFFLDFQLSFIFALSIAWIRNIKNY